MRICEDWFHIECCGYSKRCYESLPDETGNMFRWFCAGCKKAAGKLLATVANVTKRTLKLELAVDMLKKRGGEIKHDGS